MDVPVVWGRPWMRTWGVCPRVRCRAKSIGLSALSGFQEASVMRLYVGNIPYTTTVGELRAMFEAHGAVVDVHLPTDRESGRPRGFAFVEMSEDGAGQAAIDTLNGTDVGGRTILIDQARERPARGNRD